MTEVQLITDEQNLKEAFKIREKVFVLEQNVPHQEEYDAFEDISVHYLARHNTVPCGTARWRVTDKGVKLERFAVLADYRNKDVGSKILQTVLHDVRQAHPTALIYLHAQVPAMRFYERQSFIKVGEMFSECDIDHYKMMYESA